MASKNYVQLSIPRFDGHHYNHGSMLIENFLQSKEYWTVVEAGVPKPAANADAKQRAKIEKEKLKDLKAKNYLFQAIDRAILEIILNRSTSKTIWDSMKKKHRGNERAKQQQCKALLAEFESLQMQIEHNEKKDDSSLFMAYHSKEVSKKNVWYLNTGCSNHMCRDKSAFSNLDESFQDKVKFGHNSTIAVKGRGKTKLEALAAFKNFKVLAENEADRSVKILRTDRGGEFNSKEFVDFCEYNGIKRQLIAAYTLQQNGVCERRNSTIMNMVPSQLSKSGLPNEFWPKAVNWGVHILNKSPTSPLPDMMPKEAWSGRKPIVDYFRIFGCIAYAHVPNQKKAKESMPTATEFSTGGSLPTTSELEFGTSFRPQRKKRRLAWLEDYEITDLPQDDVLVTHFSLFAYCDPLTYEEAVKEQKLQNAMAEEIGSIERNQTWELTDLPKGHKTIGVKWIYKTKLKENGEVGKFKARLVAKDYKQEFGIDYQEVFAPVARMDTIRMVIASAAQNSWPIYHLDVKSTFLRGNLQEQVFIDQPLGYVKSNLSIRNDLGMLEKFKQSMKLEFDMTDLVLNIFQMKNCNSVTTPIDKGVKVIKDPRGRFVDNKLYKQIVGSLMYLTTTRPDILLGVSLISRYLEHPKELHLQTAKRIFRYLCGTADSRLFYKKGDQTDRTDFANNDYAGDLDDRKNTSGFVFMLGFGAISWSSKKQPIVTLSTIEAEYVATTSCACQAIWLRRVLKELEMNQHEATSIYYDNNSTIKLSRNLVLHGRSKHIRVRYHFLRNLVGD
ncbi:hypothetical protein SLEP1_g59850, partial [Rubroshorea leprosula]